MNIREMLGRLGSESLVYGLGQAGGRLVQVALVPILTRAFPPAEYGVIELVMLVAAVVSFFAVSGMDAALARFFYEAEDREARREMATTSALHRTAMGSLLGVSIMVAAEPLAGLVTGDPVYAKYFRILGLTVPFTAIFLFANEALRVTFQPWKYIALNGFQMTLVGVLTIYLVVMRDFSVAGVLYARLAADAIAVVFAFWLLRHTLTLRFSFSVLRQMLGYGLPLVPVGLAYAVLTYADRQVLVHARSLEEVGVYSAAVKLAAPALLAVTAFQLAWGPMAFAAAGDRHAGHLYSRVLTLFVAAGTWLALAVALFAREVVALGFVDRAYAAAPLPAGFLAFATVAHGAYYIAALGANLEKKNHWLVVTTGVAAAVTLALALSWVRPWGGAGVAAATLCGFTVSTVSLYLVSQRLRRFPYRGVRSLLLFAAGVVVALAASRLPPPAAGFVAGTGLWLKVALWLGFGAAAAWLAAGGRVARPAAEDEAVSRGGSD